MYYTDKNGQQWIERYQVSMRFLGSEIRYVVIDLDRDASEQEVSKFYTRESSAIKKALNLNLDQRKLEGVS
jgi:hypothetical protein